MTLLRWILMCTLALGLGCGGGGDNNGDGGADGGQPDGDTDADVGCPETSDPCDSGMTKLECRQARLAQSSSHTFDCPPVTSAADCDVTLTAGSGENGDASLLNSAVEDAVSFDIICLAAGTFELNAPVTVTAAQNITIKGVGDLPDDVVLDFAGQADKGGVGGKGFDVTTGGFWIENLTIKNSVDNGVEVKATNSEDNPNVFRKLKVFWDRGSSTENGAYSVYPTRSSYVVVEFCDVAGASDAGLYIGQVEHGAVRHNYVHENVAGLEVENSNDVVVYSNRVTGNSGGILALQEPGLMRLANSNVLIRDNDVFENNGENFAQENATVANIPSGTGLMAFAGDGIEFRDNTVTGNISTGMLVVSNVLLCALAGDDCEFQKGYNPYPSNIFATGNTFSDNGGDPQGAFGLITLLLSVFELEDIIWDGIIEPKVADPNICLADNGSATFRDLTDGTCPVDPSEKELTACIGDHTDATARNCTLDPIVTTFDP